MTLHTRAADMLERYGRVDGVMHCEVSMLIAELRASAALDDLTRENERLGLYDDQRPVAWRCRDYVTGCWFISDKPDPAGSIAGGSVPLYAAPAPAQPRQPLSDADLYAMWDNMRMKGYPNSLRGHAAAFARQVEAAHGIGAITGEKP